jgi:type I restriction-modification system DNA methylase subunit
MTINQIIDHIRNRAYMSGIERNSARIKATQEVFTPTVMVQDILNRLDQVFFLDPTQDFIDPTCGDGQFLGEVLIQKIKNGQEFKVALSTIYGVDLMEDNVKLCRERLLCGQEDLRHIVERNIVCHNALTYDYSFNGTNKNDLSQFEKLYS